MTQSSMPNYQECNETLRSNSISISAGEFHGLLTGVLCAGLDATSNWLTLLYDYTNQGSVWPKSAKMMAESFFAQTSTSLDSELMDFALLQPENEKPLALQAQALSDWVNGFLAGFGIAGASQVNSIDNKEILEDLTSIAQLGIDEDENETEQLELLLEIREHVRICVLSLYADNLLRKKTKPSRALH